MRVVTIPPEVDIEIPKADGRVISMVPEKRSIRRFLQESFDFHDGFSKGHVNALLYAKLTKILESLTPESKEIWFEDGDFKKVEDAVAGVQWLTPKMNAAYIPFYEAVKVARTEVLATEKK